MKYDLLACGAAGQGVKSMSRVITLSAVSEGYDAKSVAFFGIAKTEGPVWAHTRIGLPAGPSPKIRRGQADALIAFDRMEAMKNAHFLKKGGLVILDEAGAPPVCSRLERDRYPTFAQFSEVFAHAVVHTLPAQALALQAGSVKMTGAVMLGALCALSKSVLDRDHVVVTLRGENPGMADAEAEAFFAGFGHFTGKDF